jgi:hypothetical protein
MPLDGKGSLSEWMGRTGDLCREASPECSHAQLITHSKELSALRVCILASGSIPNWLRLLFSLFVLENFFLSFLEAFT